METNALKDFDWSWSSVIFALLIAVLLFVALFWQRSQQHSDSSGPPDEETSSKCTSPTCLRCHLHDHGAIREVLLERAAEYAQLTGEAADSIVKYLHANYPRVLSTFESIDRKDEILMSVYEDSGYKSELAAFQQHIWTIPGVRKIPFWSKEDVIPQTTIDQLKAVVFGDYRRALLHKSGWKVNSIPSGTWRLYQLYDQGTKSESNCTHCPNTVSIIEALPNFMKDVAFGNAMFSVLEPGSRIEPHCGPCNFRLRCHLPVTTPPTGFSIQVGPCVEQWRSGQLMVFDDSFVHRVWHQREKSPPSGDGGPVPTAGCSERVVLIVDVWHPDVREHERDLIKYAFGLH